MVPKHRILHALGGLVGLLLVSSCAHPAERALQGRWEGQSVENFDKDAIAGATAWARGTSFEFEGRRLTVSVPAKPARTGVYELVEIQERHVTLSVLDSTGEADEMELIVDDEESLRWVLDEGRTLVMARHKP